MFSKFRNKNVTCKESNKKRKIFKLSDKQRFKNVLTIILILVLAALLRIYQIEADPFMTISGDTGLYTDEGFYSLSARNLVIFKEFNPYQNNQVVEAIDYPLYTYSQFLSFKIFGVSIKSLRLPSIVFSLLLILSTYIISIRLYGKKTAILTSIFLTFNFMFIQYNRLALVENLLTLLLYVASFVYFLTKYPSSKKSFILGLLLGLSFITKGTVIFFLPALLLWLRLMDLKH